MTTSSSWASDFSKTASWLTTVRTARPGAVTYATLSTNRRRSCHAATSTSAAAEATSLAPPEPVR